jgi:thiol-disulfide isomerase/thioredoxin
MFLAFVDASLLLTMSEFRVN